MKRLLREFFLWSYYNCKGKHKICPIRSKWGNLASWAPLKLDRRWNCSLPRLKCLHNVHISTISEKGIIFKTSSMFQSSFVFSGHFPKTGRIHPLGTSLELILLPISSVLETILRWKLGKSGFIIEHFPCKNILKKTKSEIYLWSYFNA